MISSNMTCSDARAVVEQAHVGLPARLGRHGGVAVPVRRRDGNPGDEQQGCHEHDAAEQPEQDGVCS